MPTIKFQPISTRKKILLALLFLMLGTFFIYVQRFASVDAKVFMGSWNIDKLFHIFGGIFLALLFEWLSPGRILPYLLLLVGALAIGWEVFEYNFLPDVIYFAHHSPDLWRLDSMGDITSAFLGAYGYWIFFAKRQQVQFRAQVNELRG